MEMATPVAAGPSPMVPVPATVRGIRRNYSGVYTLEIEPPEGDAFRFKPGQFNMLYAYGVGEAAISICGDPEKPESLVHTIRAVGAVTRGLTQVKAGDQIGLRGPFGSAWPVEAARGQDVLVVAGGLGLAPVRPALYWLSNHHEAFNRVTLLYGTRDPATILYERELGRLSYSGNMNVFVTVDRADPEWAGNVGLVTGLVDRARFDPANTTAFICGPEVMMRFAAQTIEDAGVPPERIYLSLERNMKCAIKQCGRCQFGPVFICQDGPVFPLDVIDPYINLREY